MESSGNPRPHAKWVRHGILTIQDPEVSERLDRYLSHRFAYRSRTQWVCMIEEGRIRVNGRQVRGSQRVRFGDRIEYIPKKTVEPAVSFDWRVLAEDEWLLAVEKPANLPVHPSGRYFRNTLLADLLESRGESLDHPGVRIVHRLDRETSGIVLFGKDRLSTSRLASQFEARRVEKEYLLLVHGCPSADRYTVDAPLGRNVDSRVRKAMGVVPEGLSAQTEFLVRARGREHALLSARPRTGRFHQIRVHTRHAGFPIVGDKLYGLDEEFFLKMVEGREFDLADRERLLLERQGLHAHRLTLKHPKTREPVTFVSPLPADMRAICATLGIDPSIEVDSPSPVE
ncbi:MAG: RluA family pseudouridine synthase [Candidatus Eisenbacteria bacterium]